MVNVRGEEHDSHFYTKLGAISSLVINEQHLVYSTLFGGGGGIYGVAIVVLLSIYLSNWTFLEIETFSSTIPVGD